MDSDAKTVYLEPGAQVAAPQASQGELGVAASPLPAQVVADAGSTELLRCGHVTVRRYRYRRAQIPTPWAATG
jgi:hypothetical protein